MSNKTDCTAKLAVKKEKVTNVSEPVKDTTPTTKKGDVSVALKKKVAEPKAEPKKEDAVNTNEEVKSKEQLEKEEADKKLQVISEKFEKMLFNVRVNAVFRNENGYIGTSAESNAKTDALKSKESLSDIEKDAVINNIKTNKYEDVRNELFTDDFVNDLIDDFIDGSATNKDGQLFDICIDTERDILPYMPVIKGLEYVICPEYKISYSHKKKLTFAKCGLGLLAKSRLTRKYVKVNEVELEGTRYDVTYDFAKVSLDKDVESKALFQYIIDGFAVDGDILNPSIANDKMYGINEYDTAISLDTGKVDDSIDTSSMLTYVFLAASFSGNRNGSFVACSKYYKNKDGVDARNPLGQKILRDVNKLVDSACLGAASLLNMVFGKDIAPLMIKGLKEKAKYTKITNTLPGRYAQVLTGSNDLGTMKNYALLDFAFCIDGEETSDGMTLMTSVEFARLLGEFLSKKLELRVYVDPTVVEGWVAQARPGLIKASTLIVNPSFMGLVWRTIKGLKEGIVIGGVALTKEEFRALYGYKDNTNFDFNVYGDIENDGIPSFISDANSTKLDWDFKKDTNFEVLALAHEGDARLSFQGSNKLLAQDKDATAKVINRLADKEIDKAVEKFLMFDENSVNRTNVFTEKEFSYDITDKILKSNPVYGNGLAPIAIKKGVKNLSKSLVNIVNKLKFTLDQGGHYTLQSDITSLVVFKKTSNGEIKPVSLIPKGYCYNNSLARKDVKRVMLIKHPSQGFRETVVLKVMGIKDIMENLNDPDIVCDYSNFKDVILSLFKSLHDGVMMVAADKDLMNKLSGLDFDFDSVIAYGDKDIIKIAKDIDEISVEIRDDEDVPGIEEIRNFIAKFEGINDLSK